jgi:hypothetical protein
MSTGTKGDYEVGYGKPPRGAGFKKGQSGNPRGRPPGGPPSEDQNTLRAARRARDRMTQAGRLAAAGFPLAHSTCSNSN